MRYKGGGFVEDRSGVFVDFFVHFLRKQRDVWRICSDGLGFRVEGSGLRVQGLEFRD
jgi:hypothetical protein